MAADLESGHVKKRRIEVDVSASRQSALPHSSARPSNRTYSFS